MILNRRDCQQDACTWSPSLCERTARSGRQSTTQFDRPQGPKHRRGTVYESPVVEIVSNGGSGPDGFYFEIWSDGLGDRFGKFALLETFSLPHLRKGDVYIMLVDNVANGTT